MVECTRSTKLSPTLKDFLTPQVSCLSFAASMSTFGVPNRSQFGLPVFSFGNSSSSIFQNEQQYRADYSAKNQQNSEKEKFDGTLFGSGFCTETFNFSWVLKNFSKLDNDKSLISSNLFPKDHIVNWCLKITPAGEKDPSAEYVSCFLICNSASKEVVRIQFTLYFSNLEHKIICRHDQEVFFSALANEYGPKKFVDRHVLLDNLIDDVLIVSICMTSSMNTSRKDEKFDFRFDVGPLMAISENFYQLLKDKKNTDFVISVRGTEMPVHRAVMVSQSPVFRAMFEHETIEKRTQRVEIDDVEPELMKSFLEFVYSGKIVCLDPTGALALLHMAEKYDVKHLKSYCCNFLIPRLDVDNVAQVLVDVDMLNVPTLRCKAIEYLAENRTSFDFVRYRSLLEQRPKVLVDLILKIS